MSLFNDLYVLGQTYQAELDRRDADIAYYKGLIGADVSEEIAVLREELLLLRAQNSPALSTLRRLYGLTPTQARIMLFLVERGGTLTSKDQIIRAVWPLENEPDGVVKLLDVLANRIRAAVPDTLVTVKGHGFELTADGLAALRVALKC